MYQPKKTFPLGRSAWSNEVKKLPTNTYPQRQKRISFSFKRVAYLSGKTLTFPVKN